MTAGTALDFTYAYPFASGIVENDRGVGLRLATCGARREHPHFFEGRLLSPRVVGDMLLVLSEVVRTHFFINITPLLDPVVTSSESMLRFEGFSGCCGVYARVDLLPDAFESDLQNRGTTNVDFNSPMRAALARMRDREEVRLSVGQSELALARDGERVIEKKVKLPVRWLKGFSEVQAYQPGLSLKLEASGAEARNFVRALPRTGPPKQPLFVSQLGRSLRLTPREQKGAVRIMGTHRVRVLEPLMLSAKGLRIWADDAGASAWEVRFDTGRFFLMLSPEVYRGFSGEGQVLEKLAVGDWETALPQVQAQLRWQSHINVDDLIARTGCPRDSVEAALAVLGARGLAGFDVVDRAYFHRVLPFDLEKVEALQPRLKDARKLLAEGRVALLQRTGDDADVAVEGSGVTHTVRLRTDLNKCTCPWFSRHRGERGPCKHILAAQMFLDDKENSQ